MGTNFLNKDQKVIRVTPPLDSSKFNWRIILSFSIVLFLIVFSLWFFNNNSSVSPDSNLTEKVESTESGTSEEMYANTPEINGLENLETELDEALFELEGTLNEIETYELEEDLPPTL